MILSDIWHPSPLARLAICLSLGIVSAHWYCGFLIIGLLLSLSMMLFSRKKLSNSILLMSSFFFLGVVIKQQDEQVIPSFPQRPTEDTIMAELRSSGTERFGKLQFEAFILRSNHEILERNKVQVILDSNSSFHLGDVIIAHGKWYPFKGAGKKSDFDYSHYMQSQGIFSRFFVDSVQCLKNSSRLIDYPRKIQSVLLSKIIVDPDIRGLLAALLVGWKQELSKATKHSFQASGVIHILAVSGLHVGLIMLVLQRLSYFLKHSLHGRIVQFILILSGLWIYAFLTGGGASVLRAACMFSFLSLSILIGRKRNSFNLLGASAIFLLFFNPALLFQAGFQLSYLAVSGLLLYRAQSYRQEPLPKLIKYFKEGIITSVVAQIWTSPVSLRLFGVFPTYFIIGNLIILPIGITLLYLGLSALALSPIPVIGDLFMNVCGILGHWMICLSQLIAELPYALIPIPTYHYAYTLGFIWLLVFLRECIRKNIFYLLVAVTPIVLLSVYSSYFKVNKKQVLSFNREKDNLFIESPADQINHMVSFGRCTESPEEYIKKWNTDELSLEYLETPNANLVILYKWKPPFKEALLDCDVLVLAGPMPRKDNTTWLLNSFSPELVLLHPGYYRPKSQKWRQYLAEKQSELITHEIKDGWLSLELLSR